MSHCKWSDIITGVAWSVWHNEHLFREMKMRINCDVPSPATCSSKAVWPKWLSGQNRQRTGYNLHDLWIWYVKRTMGDGFGN